ncbi:MAG: type II secretion system minor pseudopilin GspJ [Pseudomonadota bacterium]
MTQGTPSRSGGFTLIETLVALFILSLLSAAGTALLLGALRTGDQVKTRDAALQDIDLAQTMLRNDLAALSPRGVRPDDGFSDAGNLFGESQTGQEPFLRFVRSGWINPGMLERRSTLQAVDWRVENGQLIRRAELRTDTVRDTPVSEQVILDGIDTVSIRFLRGTAWSETWLGDAGQPLAILPDLIEVTFEFETDQRLRLALMTGGRR